MPSSNQSVIDKRGYIFSLPTLGLPDLAGEWVHVEVAIASKDAGILALNAGAYDAPRRFPCSQDSVIDVEYEGAVWILPLCAPEKSANDTEVFTLKARRHLASSLPDPKRIKLLDGLGMWCVEHQEGLASFKSSTKTPTAKKRPTEENEKAFWTSKFAALLIGLGPQAYDSKIFNARWMKLNTSAHLSGWHSAQGKEQPPADWAQSTENAFEEKWSAEVQAQALVEAVKGGASPDMDPPNFQLQARMKGEEVILEYACVFDDERGKRASEGKWKVVPPRAWRLGYELKFVNQVRKTYGKKPLTEEELPLARPTLGA